VLLFKNVAHFSGLADLYVGPTALKAETATVLLMGVKISHSMPSLMPPVIVNSQQCLIEEMQNVLESATQLPYAEQHFKC